MKKIGLLTFLILPNLVYAICDSNSQSCPKRVGNAMTPPVIVDYTRPQAPSASPTDPTQLTCPANTVLGRVTVTQAEQFARDFLSSKQEGVANANCSGPFVSFYTWVFCARNTIVTQGAQYTYQCFPVIQQRTGTWIKRPFNF